jgi:hypothetical protein
MFMCKNFMISIEYQHQNWLTLGLLSWQDVFNKIIRSWYYNGKLDLKGKLFRW